MFVGPCILFKQYVGHSYNIEVKIFNVLIGVYHLNVHLDYRVFH